MSYQKEMRKYVFCCWCQRSCPIKLYGSGSFLTPMTPFVQDKTLWPSYLSCYVHLVLLMK